MDTARSLKVAILALVVSVFVAFTLDDTIKGLLAMDILLVAAYIAAIATAWIVYDEDGRIGSLPVAAMIITAAFGAEIAMLITDINVAISRWNDLSTLHDPDRYSTMLAAVVACVPLLLITLTKPSSPKYDNNSDDDNKG